MDQQRAEIARREQHCMEIATSKTSDEIARIRSAQEPTADEEILIAKDQGKRELQRCKEEADRAKEELSSRERAEYQQQGEEERQRSSLMMMLTTSRPH